MGRKDRRQPTPEIGPLQLEPFELHRAQPVATVDQTQNFRIHPGCVPLNEMAVIGGHKDTPQIHPDVLVLPRHADLDLVYDCARRTQGTRHRAHGGLDGRVDGPESKVDRQREAQTLDRRRNGRLQVERARNGEDVGVVRSLGCAQEQAHVVDRPSQRAVVRDQVEEARQRIHRDATQSGLQPDDSAPGGRDPHRPSHVRAFRQRGAAGRDRRRASSR